MADVSLCIKHHQIFKQKDRIYTNKLSIRELQENMEKGTQKIPDKKDIMLIINCIATGFSKFIMKT